ncbi:MAG: efflux RND transporter permease subunit, partial [Bacteroidia bacterium]|nr:efflux RND transporter permease subunit [Bacteroidia bacterium]
MKKPDKLVTKEFPLTTLAIENRTSVIILAVIVTIFGIVSYLTMPKESYPEVVLPQIYVGTSYPGNSPVDMENLITRPIEKELKSISGVKDITSTSIQDYSTIIAEFNTDVEIAKALQDVKDAVDQAKSELPNDLDQDPEVFELNFSEFPIMYINLSGDFTLNALKAYGEYLQDEIEKLSEISYVDIQGALEREIRVNADLYQMEAREVSFGDIADAIAAENVTISGGNIKEGDFRRSIRVVGEFESVRDMENIVIKSEGDGVVYLKDVAEVEDTHEETESYARLGKEPVITLNVVKRSGENILEATDKIQDILEDAKKSYLPAKLKITITNDQSREIRFMVSNLENSIISGVILVVLVLLFFMGVRSALFVGVAIPLSMFISFIILNIAGVTLNMMVLFSLILALGMLVDNGIVVIENIYRLLEEGYPIKRAVKEGVGEIAVPIITSTATTVAAFLPLAFWGGLMGSFMKYLPITLIVVLSASLFVALVINPAIAFMFARLETGQEKTSRRTLITGAAFMLFSIPFYIAGSNTLANLLMIVGVFIYINIYLLSPASYWFQTRFLTWL